MLHKILLSLLWSLVEVHSQPIAPYVSFMGENLPNHAYVDLTLVGEDDADGTHSTVRCNTDLGTCCRLAQGDHRGDWYFPDGSPLPLAASEDIRRTRGDQRIMLNRRNNAASPFGIYRCEIGTEAVSNAADTLRAMVYVGLYPANGGNVMHHRDTNKDTYLDLSRKHHNNGYDSIHSSL